MSKFRHTHFMSGEVKPVPSILQYLQSAVEYLRLISLPDVIDIAILAYVAYKIIGLIQQTNAAKAAKALLILVVALWLSYQLHLNAINFLLSKAVELGFLALVILFQPEIRRFLEQIGNKVKMYTGIYKYMAYNIDNSNAENNLKIFLEKVA